MKKFLILTPCLVVILTTSGVSFAQDDATGKATTAGPVGIASHVPGCPQATLPFGYPPYPTVGDYPAFGAPYSYPRTSRRLSGRLAPPTQFQPYPLPAPGSVPGAVAPVPGPIPPTFRNKLLPQRQGTLGAAVPPMPGLEPLEPPTVVYRPTPIKNFMTLMSAPRPYIGYDPYAGAPPAPPFVPAQMTPASTAGSQAPPFEPTPPPPFVPAPPPPSEPT